MFNKELALFTSVCLTFSWVILFFTGRPLTNLPASFFLIVALYFFWRGYVLKEGNKFTYLFGLFFGITILTRTQYLMFAIPFFAIIFLKEKFKFLKNKNLWITVGIMLLVYLPQFIIHWGHFGNPILDLANYYLGIEGISQKAEVGVELAKFSDLFIYFSNLPYMLSKAIFTIFIIGIFYFFFDLVIGIDKIFKNRTLQTKLFILVWIVSTFIVLGYMAPHLEQRYVMQTLPFLFLIAVSPLPLIKKIITKKTKINKRITTYILLIILIGLMIPNLLLANTLIEAKKTSFMEVKQAGEWIKENSNPEDVVMSASLPQMTYYSERSTYPYHLGYRRDLPRSNASEVEEFIEKEKVKYLIASVFEQQSRNWEYFTMAYPQKNNETMKPIQGYFQGEQPILIIYEATYQD